MRARAHSFVLGLVFVCVCPAAVLAILDGPPGSTTAGAEFDAAGLDITVEPARNTGEATVRVPIQVPPGPMGLQPDLALVYFRNEFYSGCLARRSLRGLPLTLVELDALRSVPRVLFDWAAEALDPRIRVASPPYDRRPFGDC